jgi:hypothetical protein
MLKGIKTWNVGDRKLAVTATIGVRTPPSASAARSRRANSWPSMRGMWMSARHGGETARAHASSASTPF